MRTFIFVLILVSLFFVSWITPSSGAENKILINEINITGGTGKTTQEFIELYNPTNSSLSLNGWRIEKYTKSSTGTDDNLLIATLPDVNIAPNDYFLIAHTDFAAASTTSPDILYPAGSGTQTLTSNNTVLLIDPSGLPIDIVGYGSATAFEGSAPAPQPGANKSIKRISNTNDNASDFIIDDLSPTASKNNSNPEPSPTNNEPSSIFTSTTTNISNLFSLIASSTNPYESVSTYILNLDEAQAFPENQNSQFPDIQPINLINITIKNDRAAENLSAPIIETAPQAVQGTKIQNKTTLPKPDGKGVHLPTTIIETKTFQPGAKVILSGTVTVLPGILGSQYFYIQDEFAGIQIYSNKKLFPELAIGDEIEITGELSIASGQQRIKTKNLEDIRVIQAGQNQISPASYSIAQLSKEQIGMLVQIEGELTQKKSTTWFLDDGNNEIVVKIKTETTIKNKDYKTGERYKIIGILSTNTTGLQLLPRSPNDIQANMAKIASATTTTEQIILQMDEEKDETAKIPWFLGAIPLTAAGAYAGIKRHKKNIKK